MGYTPAFPDQLLGRIRLSEVIGRRVRLCRRGREFVALCPFHNEKTPSFYVVEQKGFFHCFGCGAHGDAIQFLMRADNVGYAEALAMLVREVRLPGPKAGEAQCACGDHRRLPAAIERPGPTWIPILPIPTDAAALLRPDGRTVELFNPKQAGTRMERVSYRPAAWWAYRDAAGRLLGYVLRNEFLKPDNRPAKWTPQITLCAGPDGVRRWCVVPFPDLPLEKWTPGYADFASACCGVM